MSMHPINNIDGLVSLVVASLVSLLFCYWSCKEVYYTVKALLKKKFAILRNVLILFLFES